MTINIYLVKESTRTESGPNTPYEIVRNSHDKKVVFQFHPNNPSKGNAAAAGEGNEDGRCGSYGDFFFIVPSSEEL